MIISMKRPFPKSYSRPRRNRRDAASNSCAVDAVSWPVVTFDLLIFGCKRYPEPLRSANGIPASVNPSTETARTNRDVCNWQCRLSYQSTVDHQIRLKGKGQDARDKS